MTTNLSNEIVGASNIDTVIMAGCFSQSVTTAGVKLCAFGAGQGCAINYPCPGPGIIENIIGEFLASASGISTQMIVYKQAGGTGSFTATTAATTAVNSSTSMQGCSYLVGTGTPVTFAANDVLALYIVPASSATITSAASVGVRMFV